MVPSIWCLCQGEVKKIRGKCVTCREKDNSCVCTKFAMLVKIQDWSSRQLWLGDRTRKPLFKQLQQTLNTGGYAPPPPTPGIRGGGGFSPQAPKPHHVTTPDLKIRGQGSYEKWAKSVFFSQNRNNVTNNEDIRCPCNRYHYWRIVKKKKHEIGLFFI